MIAFRIRGRTVSVECSELDQSVAGVQLDVRLDHEQALEATHVFSADTASPHRLWLVHLPAELYDGRPRHIGLQVRSDGRPLETAAFWFTGSARVVNEPAETSAAQTNASPASLEEKQETAENDGAPGPAAIEPPRQDGRRRLTDFLREEFNANTADRVLGYFDIIDVLGTKMDTASRRNYLADLVDRMQRMSVAANDSRPVEASIIIPVFNCIEFTIACVMSVFEHAANARHEIIIADDASSDETAEVFAAVGGIVRCITQQANEGFIRNCNLSARHARGKYVVLLNNDTFVLDGWLDELLAPFNRFAEVGLTGSKLLMSDGSLQEAGGIIWRDASGWNFGRGQDPTLPEFNYVKDVDYISGATIAIPKRLWDEIGGFDERYVPAYFEDSDLAFTLRAKGLRTLYAPASQLIHHEGVSNGTDLTRGIKAHQLANTPKFVDKWWATLEAEQYPNGEHVLLARDRSRRRKHILVIDHYIPQPDRDAGSRTMFSYLKMFVDAGLQVTFWPDNLYRDRAYLRALQDIGVEVLYGPQLVGRFAEWIRRNGAYLDYVFLSRAHVAINYIDDIRECSAAKILYYGHDLPYERLKQEYVLTGLQKINDEMKYWLNLDKKIWEKSDVIYYPAQEEVESVKRSVPDKAVRPFAIYVYPEREITEARARVAAAPNRIPTVLFVGGFRHRPNVDAALWFVREILPLVKTRIPEIRTILAGSHPPSAVTSLAATDVLVTGYIPDPVLEWFYQSASVAVLPLRFGGGIKGKLIEALRYGVPVVTTSWGAQGLPQPDDYVWLADSPQVFAECLAEAIELPEMAQDRARSALDYIHREFGYAAVAARMAVDIPELGGLCRDEIGRPVGPEDKPAMPGKRRARVAHQAVQTAGT